MFIAGNGGQGGTGGLGEKGQVGGFGGNRGGDACEGGEGGDGGNAGNGGSGSGGSSVGIMWKGQAPILDGAPVSSADSRPNMTLGIAKDGGSTFAAKGVKKAVFNLP